MKKVTSLFIIFFFIFSIVVIPAVSANVNITLAWDANSEDDLAGYRIFVKSDGTFDYVNPDWEGLKGTTTCTITSLDDSKTWCFVARAFDESDNESGNSNEVCWTKPDTEPGIIRNIKRLISWTQTLIA